MPEHAQPPLSLTRLVGRRRELAEVERLVGASRLVTLTGVGGTGKTRLAAELAQRIPDAAWVELGASTDPLLVAQQTVAALSLRETEKGSVGALIDALRERELLLVFDNCEHLIDACAELARMLLSHCPRLRIVATSREPLGIPGEQVWPVPPLDVNTEAVELFADRAMAVDPSFALDATNSAAVAEICRRLDGLPLAIELAAARVRVLTPEQIVTRLADALAILSGGARTVPRHRTLRAAIDWSFALLTEREQTLLARLSVFAGTFSIDVVEAVCTDETIAAADVLDLLGGLVDKSLVATTSRDAAARYYLLETIRHYAAEHLRDAEALRRRHAEAFLAVVRDAEEELLAATVARMDRLDADHDNIRAALAWSIEHEPDAIALPLAAVFRWYWYYRIVWREGQRWLARVLERASENVTRERAAVISGAGVFAYYLGDLTSGRRHLEQAESMFRALGDERQLALTLAALAQLLATAGDTDAAMVHADAAVALAHKVGTPWELGYCLTNAAAFVAQARGELEAADRGFEAAQAIFTELRHPLGLPFVLNARALLALRRGDHAAAEQLARQALHATRSRRDFWFSSRSLRILAFTTARDPLRAARLLGASACMLRSTTASMLLHEKGEHDRLMSTLRETLAPEALEEALRAGTQMTFDEACDFALEEVTPTPRALLQVNDLGALRITLDGQPLAADGRSSGRARELLAFLVAHADGCTKEEVGVALWPDATTEQVKNTFHVTLHRLRKLLGTSDAVIVDEGRYRIALPHVAASRKFESETTAALRDPAKLEEALALYEGDYLQGEDVGDWCTPIRTRLRQLYLRAMFAYGQGLEARGRYADAADAYSRIVAREPFHEAACRQLMICRARLGARSESLLIYRRLEERLREDLSAVPENETRTLYRRLQQNESV